MEFIQKKVIRRQVQNEINYPIFPETASNFPRSCLDPPLKMIWLIRENPWKFPVFPSTPVSPRRPPNSHDGSTNDPLWSLHLPTVEMANSSRGITVGPSQYHSSEKFSMDRYLKSCLLVLTRSRDVSPKILRKWYKVSIQEIFVSEVEVCYV